MSVLSGGFVLDYTTVFTVIEFAGAYRNFTEGPDEHISCVTTITVSTAVVSVYGAGAGVMWLTFDRI